MTGLKRNKRTFWYCPYQGEQRLQDDYLNYTGEIRIIYGAPIRCEANVSPASGASQTEMFGNLDNYDKVIAPLPHDFSITENDVLFVDKAPEFNDDGGPMYDYKVRRIAKSINHTSVAIKKVDVS